MYPQNVRMARTLSGVTSSTIAPSESSYTGLRGPAFPYSLYTQNTAAGPSAIPGPGISVGFPGMTDNYQRRIGPDGEDIADLIGPDGHTEQLPPYTRYPDEMYNRKIAAANAQVHPDPLADRLADPMMAPMSAPNTVPIAVPETIGAVSVPTAPAPAAADALISESNPIQAIPGAGGIGLASRNPEFDGVEDAELPHSRYSLRSFNSDGSVQAINIAARNVSEKRKHRAPGCITRYGGRRILGVVPYWAICLVVTVLVLMAIILGSVIGTFVAKHKREQDQHQPYVNLHLSCLIASVRLELLTFFFLHRHNNPVAITVTVDATPIPTPTNLPRLPIGTFALPFHINESPGACFNDTTQAQAWKCSISDLMSMTLTIASLPVTADGPMYNVSIHSNESATYENNVFYYGEQPPTIPTPTALQLVNDTLDPDRGPAWFKMLPYNKTVIVRESYLSVSSAQSTSSAKRSSNNRRDYDDLTGVDGLAGPFGRKGAIAAQAGEKPWVCTWPDTILEVFIYPEQNASLYKISLSSTYTPTTATPTPTSAPSHATGLSLHGATTASTTDTMTSGASALPTQFFDLPPPYPRVVKMEERRMANSPEPTCVQYELKPEGTGIKAVPNLDANGQIVQITIAEVESGPSLFYHGEGGILGAEQVFQKRDESGLSKCGCLWMVT